VNAGDHRPEVYSLELGRSTLLVDGLDGIGLAPLSKLRRRLKVVYQTICRSFDEELVH
jgi:hypothetical protein